MTQTQKEIRTLHVSGLELRADGDDEAPRIVGHAAVFEQVSDPIFGIFREQFARGAFARAIKEKQDVRALFNHDPTAILGRTKSGTLTLSEDERGLLVEIQPSDTRAAQDVVESIRRGDLDQMSIAFRAIKESWEIEGADDGLDLRTVEDADLFDVSVVTYPAYPQTDVAVRAHKEWRESLAPALPMATAERIQRQAEAL